MKHSRISLFERAAEAYDFGAVIGVPPVPAPARPEERQAAPQARAPEQEAPREATPEPSVHEPASQTPARSVMPKFLRKSSPTPVRPERPQPAARVRPEVVRRPAPGVAAIDRAALAEAGYIVPEAPVTGLAEEFRLIKRQLIADIERRTALPEEKRRSILICSGQPREGKSFCALNLALSLSGEQALEVLLVDGDFAKHDLLAVLGVPPGPGLVDALSDPSSDPEDFVIRTDIEGLSLLPAGRRENNVPELLASERTREVLQKLASNPRRIILFDSPPALMASPASLLAGLVGQALVVVRADQTTESDLRETVGLLSGCDNVGLLLNGAAFNISGRNYGAYDGYPHGD